MHASCLETGPGDWSRSKRRKKRRDEESLVRERDAEERLGFRGGNGLRFASAFARSSWRVAQEIIYFQLMHEDTRIIQFFFSPHPASLPLAFILTRNQNGSRWWGPSKYCLFLSISIGWVAWLWGPFRMGEKAKCSSTCKIKTSGEPAAWFPPVGGGPHLRKMLHFLFILKIRTTILVFSYNY